MDQNKLDLAIRAIREREPAYPERAFYFLQSAFGFTLKRAQEEGRTGHVDARDALVGFRDFALQEFGPMAWPVLREWNVRSTADVGRLVFLLIEEGVLGKSDTDHENDFKGVFDLEESLRAPFLPEAV